MANIEFERDGVKKKADEKFTKELQKVGWKPVKEKPAKKDK